MISINKTLRSFITILFCSGFVFAQKPQKPNAVEIYNQLKKLQFLGSVLYIAAHPDDENTRLISYFANHYHAQTAYLSLTRGDGGQNLIGPQLREMLGVIRTQELLEARKKDGGSQYFTRANDFGFSKNPTETFEIWPKDTILADVVWNIRRFRPDIIINRFDHRTAGNTHGHHTASALLSTEAFKLANDPNYCPNQLAYTNVWQPKMLFFNPSVWFYGSQEKFDAADKSKMIAFQTGIYYSNLGKSNQEIAALSRSCHQSQGFGSTPTRGNEIEYLEPIDGQISATANNLFEGIDTSWNRVKNGEQIGIDIQKIVNEFDFNNPQKSIAPLLNVFKKINDLEDDYWKKIKSEEVKNILAACAGLYLEAATNTELTSPGSLLNLKLEAINRSDFPIFLKKIEILGQEQTLEIQKPLDFNNAFKKNISFNINKNQNYSQPYWLSNPFSQAIYQVEKQEIIGQADVSRELKVAFHLQFQGIDIPFERIIMHKHNDEVKGEIYQFLDVVPDISAAFVEPLVIFNDNHSKSIAIKLKSFKDNAKGFLTLNLPKNWKSLPEKINFDLKQKDQEQIFYFNIFPPKNEEEAEIKANVFMDGKIFDKQLISIDFPHIFRQQILKPSVIKCIKSDIKIENTKIAYIMGVGDQVPESLAQLGFQVTILKPAEITPEKLANFQSVITGIRAYNTVSELKNKQSILFDFVKSGGNMIVQYNTLDGLVTSDIAPYPLKLSSDRVTNENAVVTFLNPNHEILQFPNKISASDFKNWKQEQGLYYPNSFDNAFTPIFESNDKGESPKKGGLLVAKYGKGNYVYTGLSFFRELPEGVIGAYKLMANMIGLKPKKQPIKKQNKF